LSVRTHFGERDLEVGIGRRRTQPEIDRPRSVELRIVRQRRIDVLECT
jgi:hypothetical protein